MRSEDIEKVVGATHFEKIKHFENIFQNALNLGPA